MSDSFFIGLDDLEGIAIRGDDSELLVVRERSNSVVVVDLSSRRERSRRPLSAMTNYDTIAHYFPDPPDNNGECITTGQQDLCRFKANAAAGTGDQNAALFSRRHGA